MKRCALIVILVLILPFQLFCQTSKLPLWAAFPEGDTYPGFSFPGGGLRQAELSALINYCFLNGKLKVTTNFSISSDNGVQISEVVGKYVLESSMTLNYEVVKSQELPSGETVALVRIGNGSKISKCKVTSLADLSNKDVTDGPVHNLCSGTLLASFQTDIEKEVIEYSTKNDIYSFEYENSEGKSFRYTASGADKYKMVNSFPDRDIPSKLAAYALENATDLAFPASGLWMNRIIDRMLFSYPAHVERFLYEKEHLRDEEPELGSYCYMGNKRNNYYASSGDLSNYVAESNLDATYESKGNRISALVVSSGNGHLLLEHSDVTRESVIAESRRIYEDFIKEKLEIPLRKWQEKEEFEKTSAWEQRVNTSSLKHLEDSLLAIANEEFITSYSPHVNPELKQYDAVNEVFLSVDKTFGEIPIKVPRECAKSFKQSWENVKIIPQWSVTPNGRFILEEADFQVSPTEQYRYDRGESITYNEAITE